MVVDPVSALTGATTDHHPACPVLMSSVTETQMPTTANSKRPSTNLRRDRDARAHALPGAGQRRVPTMH